MGMRLVNCPVQSHAFLAYNGANHRGRKKEQWMSAHIWSASNIGGRWNRRWRPFRICMKLICWLCLLRTWILVWAGVLISMSAAFGARLLRRDAVAFATN